MSLFIVSIMCAVVAIVVSIAATITATKRAKAEEKRADAEWMRASIAMQKIRDRQLFCQNCVHGVVNIEGEIDNRKVVVGCDLETPCDKFSRKG